MGEHVFTQRDIAQWRRAITPGVMTCENYQCRAPMRRRSVSEPLPGGVQERRVYQCPECRSVVIVYLREGSDYA